MWGKARQRRCLEEEAEGSLEAEKMPLCPGELLPSSEPAVKMRGQQASPEGQKAVVTNAQNPTVTI